MENPLFLNFELAPLQDVPRPPVYIDSRFRFICCKFISFKTIWKQELTDTFEIVAYFQILSFSFICLFLSGGKLCP